MSFNSKVFHRSLKQPYPTAPMLSIANQIRQTAMDNGLMCYPINGVHGNHILLSSAYISA